jgi:cobalt-zinc-cadmium efflux system protein
MQSLRILMQFTPKEMDLRELESALMTIDEIENVHHVHVWQLNDQEVHFEGHLTFRDDLRISASDEVLRRVRRLLREQFSISHITLQPEIASNCEESLIRGE